MPASALHGLSSTKTNALPAVIPHAPQKLVRKLVITLHQFFYYYRMGIPASALHGPSSTKANALPAVILHALEKLVRIVVALMLMTSMKQVYIITLVVEHCFIQQL